MESHISLLFKLGQQLSVEDAISMARQKLLKNYQISHDAKKYQDLENYLNMVFYGTKSNTNIHERLSRAATTYLERHLGRTFESYDFSKNIAIQTDTSGKINISDYSAVQHKKRIEVATIQQRKQQAEKQLELLAQSPNPGEDYQKIIQNLELLKQNCEQLLSTSDIDLFGSNKTEVINVNDKTKNLIDTIDNLYQQVTFYGGLPLNMKAIGDIFEQALQVVGNGTQLEALTEEVLREGFTQSTAGAQVVSRGKLINCEATLTMPSENRNKNGDVTSVDYEVIGDNNSFLRIEGAFTPKQGKMDVVIQMPDSKDQFRVSAKNWSGINNKHDFGNTILVNALLRTSGLNPTLAYGLNVGWEGENGQAHQYAKLCAVLDILMGYSQESHWVDTIIINDRAKSKIRVFSVYEILDRICENIEAFKLSGYDEGIISSNMRDKLNYARQLGPQNYMQVIYGVLKNYRITLLATPQVLGNSI